VTRYPYFFGTLLAFVASAFLSYALARHHSHAQALVQKTAAEPQTVNREHKGDYQPTRFKRYYDAPPDPHTFNGRLAVTPEMFTDKDCNPEYYCPWGSPHRLPWWMQ
jgi:hypothetical protein